MTISRSDLEALDRADPLRPFRDRFTLPEGVIYLDGNSLGALPKATLARLREVLEVEWGRDLIRSWNKHGWIDLQARIGAKIGRLIGAGDGETIVADSTSINVFKALSAALQLKPERRVILSERDNFPTDLYMAEGLIAQLGRGYELRLAAPEEFPDAITDDVACVMLTHVSYRTGRVYDMTAITKVAHNKGALRSGISHTLPARCRSISPPRRPTSLWAAATNFSTVGRARRRSSPLRSGISRV